MLTRGLIERPKNLVVINSDPGMEDERTYAYVAKTAARCAEAGIDFIRADGPNLYEDILALKKSGKTRFDTPPFWTKNRETGKRGALLQNCTTHYKIAPMRRALRKWLHEKHGINRGTKHLPTIEQWIGFSADEADRVKESDVKYIQLRFPLIEQGMTKARIEGWFLQNGVPRPPRSVCAGCFANGLTLL